MSMEDYLKAKAMIEEKIRKIPDYSLYISGGVSEATIAGAEAELGLKFPPTYRAFLRDFGALGCSGFEVAGLEELPPEEQSFSSVVEVTKHYRDKHHFPNEYVVFVQDVDYIQLFDTSRTIVNGDNPVTYIENEDLYTHYYEKQLPEIEFSESGDFGSSLELKVPFFR